MGEFNPNIDPKKEQLRKLESEARKRNPIDQIFKLCAKINDPIITELNPNTWVSRYAYPQSNTIELGTKPMPKTIAEERFYLDKKFDDMATLIHRYLHELSHAIDFRIALRYPDIEEERFALRNFILKKNSTKEHLTAYGACDVHTNILDRSDEEFAEIFAISLFDEEYYRAYIEMLRSPLEFKKKLRLTTLSQEESQELTSRLKNISDYVSSIDLSKIQPPENKTPLNSDAIIY